MDSAWGYVAVTLLGTVASQMALKTAVMRQGRIPGSAGEVVPYLFRALLDPIVLTGLALAFIAALAWIAAISRISLSKAYPFMSLAFVLTTVLSAIFLRETVSLKTWTGIGFVAIGLVLVARG